MNNYTTLATGCVKLVLIILCTCLISNSTKVAIPSSNWTGFCVSFTELPVQISLPSSGHRD